MNIYICLSNCSRSAQPNIRAKNQHCMQRRYFTQLIHCHFVRPFVAHNHSHETKRFVVQVAFLSMVLAFGMPSLRNHFAATALLIVSSNTQSRAFSSQFSFKASSNFNNNNRIATHSFLLPRGGSGGGTLLFSTTTTTTTSTMPAASEAAGPKLEALRASLAEKNLDVYLIPSDDPHLSEYTPDAYKRRAFLTGFSGSAGTAVVTKDEALLWTDSR